MRTTSKAQSRAREGSPTETSTPQEHYNQLHRKISHTWDLVVMQAREQLR